MKATSMNLEQRSMKPLMMYFAALTATAANAADIRFTLDKPGNVSLGICDAKGRMIRTLLRAKPLPAGRHTVDWDGLDRDGTPMAGDFQWRLAASQGLESEYLLSIGTSMREHHWPAQHDALCAVAVDDQRIYVTAGLSEGMPQTAAMTRDGGWQWVSVPTGGWMGGYDLAVDGETLYFLGGPVTGTPNAAFRAGGNDRAHARRSEEPDHLGHTRTDVLARRAIRPAAPGGRPRWRVGGCIAIDRAHCLARSGHRQGDRPAAHRGRPGGHALLGGGRVLVISGSERRRSGAWKGRTNRSHLRSLLAAPPRGRSRHGRYLCRRGGASQQIKRFTSTGS